MVPFREEVVIGTELPLAWEVVIGTALTEGSERAGKAAEKSPKPKTQSDNSETPLPSDVSHLENVRLQDVMAELHGLLAVQLALLSGEHECQESVPVPRTGNTNACNGRPHSRCHRPSGVHPATRALSCSFGASVSLHRWVQSCLYKGQSMLQVTVRASLDSPVFVERPRQQLEDTAGLCLWNQPLSVPHPSLITLFVGLCPSQKCQLHETKGLV